MVGGGKSDRGKRSSAGEDVLGQYIPKLFSETDPVRTELLGQSLEALKTGGVGAQIPIAQRGVEASRAATSASLQQLDQGIAAQGGRGSQFRDLVRGQTLLQGNLATSQIPTNIAQSFIAGAPALSTNILGLGVQGAIGEGGLYNQRQGILAQQDIAKGNQETAILSSLFQAAGSAGAGACWIAAVLYGEGTPRYWAARYWIFAVWQGRLAWVARALYLRYGERIARHRWACLALKPLFDLAAWKGARAWHC